MKVHELIAKLQSMDPDLSVFYWDCEYSEGEEVEKVEMEKGVFLPGGFFVEEAQCDSLADEYKDYPRSNAVMIR